MGRSFVFSVLLSIAMLWPGKTYCQRPVNEIEVSHLAVDTSNQLDLIDIGKRLFKLKEPRPVDSTGQKVYYSFLPFSTSVPGGGQALITATTAGFYLGDRKTTNMSRVTFTPYTNFKNRFGLPIRSYVWLRENNWVIDGDIRILKFPQDTWGLGHMYGEQASMRIDYTYFRLYQHVLRRMKDGFFVGLGFDLDYWMNIRSKEEVSLKQYTGYAHGTDPGSRVTASGFSLNLIYDTRANPINPWDGNFANLQFRFNPQWMGAKEPWQWLYLELRRYHRFNSSPSQQHMLAFRNFFWTVFNDRAPYLSLPNLGWDPYNSSGRGFQLSRFRGKTLFYWETEYRRGLTRNGLVGMAAFANLTTVSGPNSTLFWNWNVGGGAGLRLKFNKNSGTNIALDYGISKHHRGIHVGLGEVF